MEFLPAKNGGDRYQFYTSIDRQIPLNLKLSCSQLGVISNPVDRLSLNGEAGRVWLRLNRCEASIFSQTRPYRFYGALIGSDIRGATP
jgi:hypothetical protein